MPNVVDQSGLQIQTYDEIVNEILNGAEDYPGMFQIYGANINVDPNTPDGQMIAIIAQAKLDMLEFINQVFASFDPDQAIGRALDQRCAINGIVRNPGTYTIQPVSVTVDRALTLPGLDTNPDDPFVVADASGTRFLLQESHVFSGAGTASLSFRAETLGAVLTTPNTLTTIATITLGVTAVNNPLVATTTGQAEETDFALRIRRAKSVALPSKGYFEGLIAALLNIEGVTSVNLLENVGDSPDSDGIPGHSIWAIVAGGTNADVANAIYVKRNAGCGMKGAVEVLINQVDGSTFPISFDRPTDEDLYISVQLAAVSGTLDPAYIRNQILQNITYQIGEKADASSIVAFIKAIAPNLSVSDEGVSNDDVTYTSLLTPTGPDYQFKLAASRIIINGTPG